MSREVLPGALTLRLREAPSHVPTHLAVRAGAEGPALRLDDGAIDRTIAKFSAAKQVTMAFASARHVGRPADGNRDWDDIEHETGLSRTLRVRFDPRAPVHAVVAALREIGSVDAVCADYLCVTPFAGTRHRREPIRWPNAWKQIHADHLEEAGDSALIIAIIDSGASLAHPELRGRLRPGADLVDLPSRPSPEGLELIGDHTGRDRVPLDENGHGTACAGILGAVGEQVPAGLAGASRLLPMRALAGARTPAGSTAIGAIPDIDAAVKLAVDLGARVLNLSFGTPATALAPSDPVPHVDVIQYALSRGCVLVAASGNAGDEVPYYPAALPGVIAVAAVDGAGVPCSFSSRGAHVAVAAPGVNIPTLAVDGYRRSTGTSFAAPFVTGAAALLIARAARRTVALDPMDVRRLLMESAAPFPTATAGMGAGVLDIANALARLDAELQTREAA